MRAIQPFLVQPSRDSPDAVSTLDGEAAARFLRAQCAWLRTGLQRACDQPSVTRVLSAHDTCHHAWVALIGAVHESLGEPAARTLATLYAFHGRVAGSLERGPDPRLSPAVCADVRALLEARLTHLTEAAVAAVTSLPQAAAQAEDG